jgi:hypothetical protein
MVHRGVPQAVLKSESQTMLGTEHSRLIPMILALKKYAIYKGENVKINGFVC